MRFELSTLAAIIILLNLPLLGGTCPIAWIFLPARVASGEWWRVFTHPFVHVSGYHLLLDASAFLILYQGLAKTKWYERIGYLLVGGAGSLLVSLWAAPLIQTSGLCGLSGIAHGLMAISALEMVKRANDKTIRRAGVSTFIIVVGKSIIEALTGHVVFEGLHFGALGSPVAVCHAGGILGGLGAWLIAQLCETIPRDVIFERKIFARISDRNVARDDVPTILTPVPSRQRNDGNPTHNPSELIPKPVIRTCE